MTMPRVRKQGTQTREAPPRKSPSAVVEATEASDTAPPDAHVKEAGSRGEGAQATLDSGAIDPTLVSNFTHQIINPLNGVVGTIDNMIDGTIPADKRQQRLRAVRAQLQGTIELVRNLAFLSQLSTEQGREGLRAKALEVSIPEVVVQAALFLEEMGERRHVDVQMKDPVTQYIVKGHSALLRQVFMNLIENAIKYSDEATTIDISAHGQQKTGNLIVEVVNIGPGFAHEEREQIFRLGYRGEEARNIRASGSGLGLFICREILALHDATIEAEYSNARRTATFRIRFPTFRIDAEATERERARGQAKR